MKYTLTAAIEYNAECPEEIFTCDNVRSILLSELDDYGMAVTQVTVREGLPDKFEDGSPVPATPHEGGGAIPMPPSSQLEEEEADRQRSYPDEVETTEPTLRDIGFDDPPTLR